MLELPNPFANEGGVIRLLEPPGGDTEARRESLLELEMALGLESPAELQQQRLAMQVKLLKERFGGGAAQAGTTGDRLLAWCAQPGIVDGRDAERRDRIFTAMGQAR